MARADDPVLRAFLRAAAIAFALSGDAVAAIDDAPEGAPRDARTRDTAPTRDSGMADIQLLDAHGRPILRLRAHGPVTLLPQPPGRYTLLIRRDGLTEIRPLNSPHQTLAGLVIAV